MDYGLAIGTGLLGSLHCAAMCGPLMLALPSGQGGAGRHLAGRILYQLGRVTTYCLLGVLAGVVGKSFFVIGMQGWVSIGLGVAILAGFFLSKKAAVSAPAVRLVAWLKQAMGVQLRQRNLRSLAILGVLNGLLPCGLVYAALASAVIQGGVLAAAGFMALFGLGTLPLMLALSLTGKVISPALRLKLSRAIPVGICLLAALLILRGIRFISPGLASGANCH